MEQKSLQEKVKIPGTIQVEYTGTKLSAKGSKGTVEKQIVAPMVNIAKQGDEFVITVAHRDKNSKRMLYTVVAHMRNVLHGVENGYEYKLKICSGHFPMSVKVDGSNVIISNFLGEKVPRKAPILPNVKVTVTGDVIDVQGPDLESTGQTAANIEVATKVKNRDRRIFQDGIYITDKPGRR